MMSRKGVKYFSDTSFKGVSKTRGGQKKCEMLDVIYRQSFLKLIAVTLRMVER